MKPRKLPGTPGPREEVLAEYSERNSKVRERIAEKFPNSGSMLWPFWAPDPGEFHRWRVQLDCRHIRELLIHESRGKPPEQVDCAEFACWYGSRASRDIVEWKTREVCTIPARPDADVPDYADADLTDAERAELRQWNVDWYSRSHTYTVWQVTLSCGHTATQQSDTDWKPEDGIKRHTLPDPGYARRRQEVLESDLLDEDIKHWFREHCPKPKPWTQCDTCAKARAVVAYEDVGPLVPPPPAPPKPPDPRGVLQRRIRKAEREAKRLRKELAEMEAPQESQ